MIVNDRILHEPQTVRNIRQLSCLLIGDRYRFKANPNMLADYMLPPEHDQLTLAKLHHDTEIRAPTKSFYKRDKFDSSSPVLTVNVLHERNERRKKQLAGPGTLARSVGPALMVSKLSGFTSKSREEFEDRDIPRDPEEMIVEFKPAGTVECQACDVKEASGSDVRSLRRGVLLVRSQSQVRAPAKLMAVTGPLRRLARDVQWSPF